MAGQPMERRGAVELETRKRQRLANPEGARERHSLRPREGAGAAVPPSLSRPRARTLAREHHCPRLHDRFHCLSAMMAENAV
jgi:hypothetical protein